MEYLAWPSSIFLYHNKFVGALIDFLVGSSDKVIDPCLAFARRCFPSNLPKLCFSGLRTLATFVSEAAFDATL